jgi:hypothetical protein
VSQLAFSARVRVSVSRGEDEVWVRGSKSQVLAIATTVRVLFASKSNANPAEKGSASTLSSNGSDGLRLEA